MSIDTANKRRAIMRARTPRRDLVLPDGGFSMFDLYAIGDLYVVSESDPAVPVGSETSGTLKLGSARFVQSGVGSGRFVTPGVGSGRFVTPGHGSGRWHA